MARSKTENVPELDVLLMPPNALMLAVQRALLRDPDWAHAAAPVAEQIAARLAGVITLDLIKPGQRLLENDISEVLRVSRAPVREALRVLERDRLVEFHPRRGALVTSLNAEELENVFAVRRALLPLLVPQVMADRREELEALLSDWMPRLAKSAESSVDEYAVEAFQLSLSFDYLGANRLVVDILRSIALRTLRYVRLGLAAQPGGVTASLRRWRTLQRAVRQGDVDLAINTVRDRVDTLAGAAIRTLSVAPAPQALAASKAAGRTRSRVPAAVR
jgi:DNA-binding GntR family transcriptional regulator